MRLREFWVLIFLVFTTIFSLGYFLMCGGMSWFGHLPGDLSVGGERASFRLPVTSFLVASAGFVLLARGGRRLLKSL